MITSSASSSGTSCSSVGSTIPAGTMIQMLRGFSSAFTKSASVVVPVAPSASSPLTASAFTS